MNATEVTPAAVAVALALSVAWNLSIGVRASAQPTAPRLLRLLSALGAFLFLPSALIALLALTPPGARVLAPLAMLWPVLTVAVLAQAVWAVRFGRAHRALCTIFALQSAMAAWIAVAASIEQVIGPLPPWVMSPAFAWSLLASERNGALAAWAAVVMPPLLAPASAARGPVTRAARVLMAAMAAATLIGIGLSIPDALSEADDATTLAARAGAVRARSDLAVGVQVFGVVDGAPSGAEARSDIALADSLGVTALHVEFRAGGATVSALDSVARAIQARRDSIQLVVTLDDADEWPVTEATWTSRVATIERIVRRLHPEVLVPAERVPRDVDVGAWRVYLQQSAAAARRVDRDVTIALALDDFSPTDSSLADWVLTQHPSIDAVALRLRDATSPREAEAAFNAVARWASFSRTPAAVWVLGVPTLPAATGERVQADVVRRALAWSASQPYVRGIIAGEASDTRAPTALRTAAGRPRAALREVSAALRAARDIPAVPVLPADMQSGAGTNVSDPLTPPPR